MSTTTTDHDVCMHEAAHAVLAAALGLPLGAASVVPGPGYHGRVRVDDPAGAWTRQDTELRLLVALAGHARCEDEDTIHADCLSGRCGNEVHCDWARAYAYARRLADADALAGESVEALACDYVWLYFVRARRMVSRPPLASCINRRAVLLARNKTVDGWRVRRIVRTAVIYHEGIADN